MTSIRITQEGEAALINIIAEGGPRSMRAVVRGITRATLILQRKVKVEKLSGQVLNVVTGTLRRSIDYRVTQRGSTVIGDVSTNLNYAPPHEFGFSGNVTVEAHLRTIRQAFGRPIPPQSVSVRAFSRRMNLPQRSFLRSALRELVAAGVINREIDRELQEGSR